MQQSKQAKIAVVIQRYGSQVLGGESLCRHVMEHLKDRFDITVLTTCARDYRSWDNEFLAGAQQESGVDIIRFPVTQQRSMRIFKWYTRFMYTCQWINNHGLRFKKILDAMQHYWLRLQGPYCPELIEHIKEHQHQYDAFVFFTYLYYPSACGILHAKDKAILFPSAHDERPIYFSHYKKVFNAAKALLMQTPEERDFVNQTFSTQDKPQRMASLYIPTLDELNRNEHTALSTEAVEQFKQQHQLKRPYILYTGRIEIAKGSKWMFNHIMRFFNERNNNQTQVDLVLLGKHYINIPKHPNIHYLGFLPEQQKRLAILGCEFFLMPSYFESLSVSLLEAFGLGKPAVVNGGCAVLRGHIQRSQAGFAVQNYNDFKIACETLLHQNNAHYTNNAIQYVQQHYTWQAVDQAYSELINIIKQQQSNHTSKKTPDLTKPDSLRTLPSAKAKDNQKAPQV